MTLVYTKAGDCVIPNTKIGCIFIVIVKDSIQINFEFAILNCIIKQMCTAYHVRIDILRLGFDHPLTISVISDISTFDMHKYKFTYCHLHE